MKSIHLINTLLQQGVAVTTGNLNGFNRFNDFPTLKSQISNFRFLSLARDLASALLTNLSSVALVAKEDQDLNQNSKFKIQKCLRKSPIFSSSPFC
jgi:hypothetical protein